MPSPLLSLQLYHPQSPPPSWWRLTRIPSWRRTPPSAGCSATSLLRAAARVLTGLFLQLIDFMITTHPAYGQLKKLAEEWQTNIHEGAAPCTVGPCF